MSDQENTDPRVAALAAVVAQFMPALAAEAYARAYARNYARHARANVHARASVHALASVYAYRDALHAHAHIRALTGEQKSELDAACALLFD